MVTSTDVLVIGGGPAGLAAALAMRSKGMDVLVADGMSSEPIDKACGEGLMPDAVAALSRLGVDILEAEHHEFIGVRFIAGRSSVEARFPHGHAVGVRRTALHNVLCRAATHAGVQFAWNSPATGIEACQVRFAGGRVVKTRWIVGADGGSSAVRRWTGLNAGMRSRERYGFRKHFCIRPWSEFVEVYWGDGCQIYVTPVSASEVGVAVVSRDRRLRVDEAVLRFPSLTKRLSGAVALTIERGALSATRKLRRVSSGSVALIGDASGSIDAVTGEGLSLAFQQAPALANALVQRDLACYETAHRRIRRTPAMMSEALLLLDRWSGLRNCVLPAMAARPKVFEGMLAGHVGGVGPMALAGNLATLGWAMVF